MDMILQHLVDPFRIGMIFFLILTAQRTQAAMGTVIPLALGVLFVAALIPLTIQGERFPAFEDKLVAFGSGVISNSVILFVCLGGWHVLRKMRS